MPLYNDIIKDADFAITPNDSNHLSHNGHVEDINAPGTSRSSTTRVSDSAANLSTGLPVYQYSRRIYVKILYTSTRDVQHQVKVVMSEKAISMHF